MKPHALLLLGVVSALKGQTHNSAPQPQIVRRSMPAPPARIGDHALAPVKMIGGLPTIEVMVGGKGPFRMGIETGFPGYLRLTPDAVEKIGVTQIGEATMGDPSGRRPQRVPIVRVESVALGGVRWRGVQADVAPIPSERLKGVDGLLGLGFFSNLLVTLDYGAGEFTITPGALKSGPGVLPVTRTEGGLMSIPISIGERTFSVHLDTGNTRHPLVMPQEAIAGMATSGAPYAIGTAQTVSQQVNLSAQKLGASVKAGNSVLDINEVAFPAIADIGNLGSLGLTGQILVLDLRHGLVSISPSEAERS